MTIRNLPTFKLSASFVCACVCFVFTTCFVSAQNEDQDADQGQQGKSEEKQEGKAEKAASGKKEKAEQSFEEVQKLLDVGKYTSALKEIATKLEKDVPPEFLYKAARTASVAGEVQTARTRYEKYLEKTAESSDAENTKEKRKDALNFLLRHGSYPEKYSTHLANQGTNRETWFLGIKQMNRLLQALDTERAANVTKELLNKFPAEKQLSGKTSYICKRWRKAMRQLDLGPDAGEYFKQIFLTLAENKTLPDNRKTFYRFMQESSSVVPLDKRLELLFAYQNIVGEPLDFDRHGIGKILRGHMMDLRNLNSKEMRLKFGKKFVDLLKTYKTADSPRYFRKYINVIANAPQIFNIKDDALFTNEQVKSMFENFTGQLAAQDGGVNVNNLVNKLQNNYFKNGSDFLSKVLNKHIADLGIKGLAGLVNLKKDEAFPELIKKWKAEHSYYQGLKAEIHFLGKYEAREEKEKIKQLVSDYLHAFPASFDGRKLNRHFVKSSLFSPAERIKPFIKIGRQGGGDNAQLREIVRWNMYENYAEGKSWRDQEEFKTLLKLVEDRPDGSNALLRVNVKLREMEHNRRHPSSDVYNVAESFLKNYEGDVPGGWHRAESPEEIALHGIFREHGKHVWGHKDALTDWAALWAPRLKAGGAWKWMVNRLADHNAHKTLVREVTPNFLELVKEEKSFPEGIWRQFARMQCKNNEAYTPLASYYGKMGWKNAFRHILAQFRHWPAKDWWKQVNQIASSENFSFTPWLNQNRIFKIFRKKANHKSNVPVAVLETFWNNLRAWEQEQGENVVWKEVRALGLFRRAGLDKQLRKYRKKYLSMLNERTLQRQKHAINTLIRYNCMPTNAKTLTSVIKPFYDEHPYQERAPLRIRRETFRSVYKLLNRDGIAEDIRKKTSNLADKLVKVFTDSLYPEEYNPEGLKLVRQVIKKEVNGEAWERSTKLLTFLATHLQRSIHRDNKDKWKNAIKQNIRPMDEFLADKEKFELSYIFLGKLQEKLDYADLKKQVAVMKSESAKHIEGLLAVDKSNPAYELHQAAHAFSVGSEGKAWKLTLPKIDLLKKYWQDLDMDYVAWVLDQMRKQEMLNKAKDYAYYILLQEEQLNDQSAARLSLVKGDVLRDMENYEAAKLEYESLMENNSYKGTKARKEAVVHLIDLLIEIKNYSAARSRLEWLKEARDPRRRADAFYLYAKMAYKRKDYPKAGQNLKKVFNLDSDHVKARLLEGQLKLHLPQGLESPDVAVGNPELQTTLIPGDPVTLKLNDKNLSVARGGDAVPIVVRTKPSGDKENVKILPSADSESQFKGQIDTRLGEVKPGNGVLEVKGNDTVEYAITEEFQEAHDLDYKPKRLNVKSEAELVASATEILTEEEMRERRMRERLEQTREAAAEEERGSARFRGRSGNTVRPGSPIYVQVKDYDRDLTNKKDTVAVDLKTSSGDVLKNFQLEELESHAGTFRGEAPTGMPAPRAIASDSREGSHPSAMINSTKSGMWRSVADGQAPKWVEVDTMSSVALKHTAISTPQVDKIKQVTLQGRLDDDYQKLAQFPKKEEGPQGGVQVINVRGKAGKSLDQIERYVREKMDENKFWEYHQADKTAFDRKDSRFKNNHKWVCSKVKGAFYFPSNKLLELTFLQKAIRHMRGYVLIDGELILGGRLDRSRGVNENGRIYLTEGIHRFELYVQHHRSFSKVKVGHRKTDGSLAPLPAEWFSVEENPDLREFLSLTAEINKTEDGFEAEFAGAERLRQIRWVFEEFESDEVAVKKLSVTNDEGEKVIPVERDFSAEKDNDTLEVAPDDRISVVYQDEKRLDPQRPEIVEKLDASYYNGEISLVHETIKGEGEDRKFFYEEAKRTRIGDQLMLKIDDYDGDISDKRDTIDVHVKTASGEEMDIEALETNPRDPEWHNHSGVFMSILKFGKETNPEEKMIKVEPGDQITVSYLDRENTDPGIPIKRSYTLFEAGLSKPVTTVLRTKTELVDDTSKEAQARIKRLSREKGRSEENITLFKKEMKAAYPSYLEEKNPDRLGKEGEIPKVSVDAPLVFEVNYPAKALHSGSTMKATLVAESELEAAQEEDREPDKVEVPLYIRGITTLAEDKGYSDLKVQTLKRKDADAMLKEGTFVGIARLQLGSHGDMVNDVVEREAGGLLGQQQQRSSYASEEYRQTVPTLLVRGNDVVRITIKGENLDEPYVKKVKLRSDAQLKLMDPSYTFENKGIHLGEKFYAKLFDPDRDRTDEPDEVQVNATVNKKSGGTRDKLQLTMRETGKHTGEFTCSVGPQFPPQQGQSTSDEEGDAGSEDTAGGDSEQSPPEPVVTPDDDILHANFGDEVQFTCKDKLTVSAFTSREVAAEGEIYRGDDMELIAYTKQFGSKERAVKTRFLTAEGMLEMAKHFREADEEEAAKDKLAEGKRVLEQALRDYPQTEYIAQGKFLLANLAQQMEQYQKAVSRYSALISKYPDSEYAPRAQFKKAVCLEKMGHHQRASEEYVKVTYLYPDHNLVAKATARLGNYFYRDGRYEVAANIFYKFQQNNPQHEVAPKGLALAGQAYMKMENYVKGAQMFSLLKEKYEQQAPDTRAEGMYWLGVCNEKMGRTEDAYHAYKQVTWDHPATKWAKISRGKLTQEKFADVTE